MTAAKLGFSVGDDVTVYFVGDEIKVRKFRLSGIFEAGFEEIDSRMAVADRRQIQRLNGWSYDEVSSLEVRTDVETDLNPVSRALEDIIVNAEDEDDTSLYVTDIRRLYGHLFDWMNLLDLNVLMVLVLMILVAGFNMVSAILIILFEQISTIGLLKSLGMTTREVGRVFLLRAGGIIGKGLLWGNVLGIGICLIQQYTHLLKLDPVNYFVSFVPIRLQIPALLLLNVVSALLILAIVSLSTRFIARVSPDKTMRVE